MCLGLHFTLWVPSIWFLPSPVLSTATLLFAVVVSCTWMVLDSCWCPRWSPQISDHLLDVVWLSSLSPVSLESRCTCAFCRTPALSAPAWNQRFFLVMTGRTRLLFVPDMWLGKSVAVATRKSSAFPLLSSPRNTNIRCWVSRFQGGIPPQLELCCVYSARVVRLIKMYPFASVHF